jgi:Protein of unknown function (DUF2867)
MASQRRWYMSSTLHRMIVSLLNSERETMSSARSIAVKLPHIRLPDADWADCFEIDINNRRLTAIEAARLSMGRMPDWVRRLVALRNFLGHFVGLKAGSESAPSPHQDKIGIFPLLSQSEREVVLGLDDWHLDFRLVIEVADLGQHGTRVRATTLVQRKNLFGRFYIGLVTPFHNVIVPVVLRGASRPLTSPR